MIAERVLTCTKIKQKSNNNLKEKTIKDFLKNIMLCYEIKRKLVQA